MITNGGHPERFDPASDGGTLMASDHLARYLWAARLSPGRRVLDAGSGTGYGARILADAGAAAVTAVDVDPDAVARTAAALGDGGDAACADLCELPFADGAFDLAVAFEVLEHVDRPERALGELARVLGDDGLLLLSTPNRGVYAARNPHHIREFTAGELRAELERHFPAVTLYAQHERLASVVAPAGDSAAEDVAWPVRLAAPLERGGETFLLAAAARSPGTALPAMGAQVAITAAFEVGWWQEEVWKRDRELISLHARGRLDAEEREALAERLVDAETRAAARAADAAAAARRLALVLASRSWRLTAPLRWFVDHATGSR